MSLQPPNETSAQVNVAVMGSTGATGKGLIDHLLNNPQISTVYSFVRRPGTFDAMKNKDKLVEIEFGDDPCETVRMQWPEVSIHSAISCLGSTIKQAGSQERFFAIDYELNDAFFTTAQAKGVRHAQLMSSVGANANSSNFYIQTKGKLEDRLKEIPFSTTLIYQPGILDNTSRPSQPSRPGECCGLFCMNWICCCFLGNCLKTWRPIDVYQIAYLMSQNVQNRIGPNNPGHEGVLTYAGSSEIMDAIKHCKQVEEQSLN